MSHKTLGAIAIVDGSFAVGVVAWAVLGQAVNSVPPLSSGWELIGFLALLGLNAYGMYIQSKASKSTHDKVDQVALATEQVHKSVNSQLDKFKAEAAAQYKTALAQGIQIATAEGQKDSDAKVTVLDRRIAALEAKLEMELQRAVALALKSHGIVVSQETVIPGKANPTIKDVH